MSDENIERLVQEAYSRRKCKNISVLGWRDLDPRIRLVNVEFKDEDGDECEEICQISNGAVRIFDGNLDFIYNLDRPSRFLEWVMSAHGISAIAFFVTLAALIIYGATGISNGAAAFDVIKQVCLLAAGFFLGQVRVPHRN